MIAVLGAKPAHGGDIRTAAVQYDIDPAQILDFSASINPLGPSKKAIAAIQEGLAWLQHYPEPEAASLGRALAATRQIEEHCIVPGNGCMELMYLSARIFNPVRIVCLAPSYREYGQGGLESQPRCLVKLKPENGFAPDLDQIDEILAPGDLLYVGHPNNPTGRLWTQAELDQMAALVEERSAYLVIDEAFLDFAGPDAPTAINLAAQNPHIVVLGSLTKFFALPGLRLGYAVAHPSRAREMQRLLPPWRVNSLAIAAGTASLADTEYIEQSRLWLHSSRELFITELNKLDGLRVYPSAANFLLVNSRDTGWSAARLQSEIGPQGLLIRNCRDFEGLDDYYFRVAIRSNQDNCRLVKALAGVISCNCR